MALGRFTTATRAINAVRARVGETADRLAYQTLAPGGHRPVPGSNRKWSPTNISAARVWRCRKTRGNWTKSDHGIRRGTHRTP